MDKDAAYKEFAKSNPSLEFFKTKLAYLADDEKEIVKAGSIHVIRDRSFTHEQKVEFKKGMLKELATFDTGAQSVSESMSLQYVY